jgi:hypothetical protein
MVRKGKVLLIAGHEGTEEKYKYSSALERVGGQRHAAVALPPGMTR